jgi:hypothetical protein
MQKGDHVEVRTRYQGSWSRGFTVAAVRGADRDRYLVRRNSDGMVLPEAFRGDDVRPARPRRHSLVVR